MTLSPNEEATIAEILKSLVATPVSTNIVSKSTMISGGDRRSRSRGPDGFDINVTTDYDPDEDDPRDVDWIATAVEGESAGEGLKLQVTKYNEPRDQNIFVIIDASITMDFGTQRTLKRYLAAELAGSVVNSAGKTDDMVGTMVYSENELHYFRRPYPAKMVLYPTITNVVTANSPEARMRPQAATTRRAGYANLTGLQLALKSIQGFSRSPVFIISDFRNLTEGDKIALRKVGTYHQVACLMVQDERERMLPPGSGFIWQLLGWGGFFHVYDMRTGKKDSIWLSPSKRKAYADNFEAFRNSLTALFKHSNCAWEEFSTEEGLASNATASAKFLNLLTRTFQS